MGGPEERVQVHWRIPGRRAASACRRCASLIVGCIRSCASGAPAGGHRPLASSTAPDAAARIAAPASRAGQEPGKRADRAHQAHGRDRTRQYRETAWLTSSPRTGGERDVTSARPRSRRGLSSGQRDVHGARSLRGYSDNCPWSSCENREAPRGNPRGARTIGAALRRVNTNFRGSTSRVGCVQRPVNRGLRFSMNARVPSRISALAKHRAKACCSSSSA